MAVNVKKFVVTGIEDLSLHVRRISFFRSDIADFPSDIASGYIKFFFNTDGSPSANISDLKRAVKRAYTIREIRLKDCEIDLDFVVHLDAGPASKWARKVTLGEEIYGAGPGPKKLANDLSDWYVFLGDMSSLPAIAVNLKKLRRNANGFAFIQITSVDDKQVLNKPQGISLRWIVNSDPKLTSELLMNNLRDLPLFNGQPYLWVAGEFDLMCAARKYLKKSRIFKKRYSYISSYWKADASQEGLRIAKLLQSLVSKFDIF